MSSEIWTLYVITVLVLMSTPGPSRLLTLPNSGIHGFRRSLAAGLGLAAVIGARLASDNSGPYMARKTTSENFAQFRYF